MSKQGPAQNLVTISKRILSLLIESIETRLQLLVVEFEEEKVNIIQLILLAGASLLLLAFALLSLLLFICFAIDPAYRFTVLLCITAVLFVATLITIIVTVRKARRSTFLKASRQQLKLDRVSLRDRDE